MNEPKDNKRVLLVNPPILKIGDFGDLNAFAHPTGLLRIASYLRRLGKGIDFIDCVSYGTPKKDDFHYFYDINIKDRQERIKVYTFSKSFEQFKSELKSREEPGEIWVTSALTYNYKTTHEIIRICKDVFPNSKIKLGGIYPTLCPEKAKGSMADEIIEGEIKEAVGLEPAYDIMGKIDYYAIQLTRGCPNNCSYCAMKLIEPELYFKPLQQVKNEIMNAVKKFGVRDLVILDSNILMDVENYFEKILDFIIDNKLDLNIMIAAGLQPNSINLDLAKKMRAAGVSTVHLSLETVDKELYKRFDREMIPVGGFEGTIDILKQAGYMGSDIRIFILAGLPNQDIKTVIDSVVFVLSRGCKIVVSSFTPVPGTREWKSYYHLIHDKDLDELAPQLMPFVKDKKQRKLLTDIMNLSDCSSVEEVLQKSDNQELKDLLKNSMQQRAPTKTENQHICF